MKEVKSKTGEVELQPPEHVPPGPVRLHPGDAPIRSLEARIAVLEAQVASLQSAMPKFVAHPGTKKTKS